MFDLTSKVAFVTGGSRGIGRATVEALAEHGAHVVFTYAINAGEAESVSNHVRERGGTAEAVQLDVRDTANSEAVIAAVAKRLGRLDILVANAGIARDGLLIQMKDDALDETLAVNVKGSLACARAALRPMMKARTGRIVFLSSVVGEMGNAGQTAYAASKAALLGAAKSLAREYAKRNITVNAVTPGFVDTDMTRDLPQAVKDAMLGVVPLGRTATAREIAAPIVFLASDEAAYVTGAVIRVNGGMLT